MSEWRFEWGYVGSERRPFAVPPEGDGMLMRSEDEARQLVRAVNAHADLLAACELGRDVIYKLRAGIVCHDMIRALDLMAEAIAKATGAA